VKRITMYCNTWDWQLYLSKWFNWTETRAGASIVLQKGLDCVDTTKLCAGWFSSNHYYLHSDQLKHDIIELLSVPGGVSPENRLHTRRHWVDKSGKSWAARKLGDDWGIYYELKNSKKVPKVLQRAEKKLQRANYQNVVNMAEAEEKEQSEEKLQQGEAMLKKSDNSDPDEFHLDDLLLTAPEMLNQNGIEQLNANDVSAEYHQFAVEQQDSV